MTNVFEVAQGSRSVVTCPLPNQVKRNKEGERVVRDPWRFMWFVATYVNSSVVEQAREAMDNFTPQSALPMSGLNLKGRLFMLPFVDIFCWIIITM